MDELNSRSSARSRAPGHGRGRWIRELRDHMEGEHLRRCRSPFCRRRCIRHLRSELPRNETGGGRAHCHHRLNACEAVDSHRPECAMDGGADASPPVQRCHTAAAMNQADRQESKHDNEERDGAEDVTPNHPASPHAHPSPVASQTAHHRLDPTMATQTQQMPNTSGEARVPLRIDDIAGVRTIPASTAADTAKGRSPRVSGGEGPDRRSRGGVPALAPPSRSLPPTSTPPKPGRPTAENRAGLSREPTSPRRHWRLAA